ncbi:phage protein Gp37 [Pseudoxanthomonas sp. 22568]|uniref:phage protein Gp37 n=1 Tax=Pseudoxanthomonas sp. 22568 TaxID=3453945 RepID=UPI003F849917
MSIREVEDYFVALIKARFARRVRAVESLPADWDDDTFRRILRQAPGVFVVFGGGDADPSFDEQGRPVIEGQWGFTAVTTHAGGELARRHGDQREIGAYEIVEVLTTLLHDHDVPGHGQMKLRSIKNLFTDGVEKQGASIYGVEFSLPMFVTPENGEQPDLGTFRTFHDDIDPAPKDGRVLASDITNLEQ